MHPNHICRISDSLFSEEAIMEDIYQRVLELMGKTPDGFEFAEFVLDLGYTPDIFINNEVRIMYVFEGIYLSYMKFAKCFATVYFHDGSTKTDPHASPRYSGRFPTGIQFGDSRETVQQKLGCRPLPDGLSYEIGHSDAYELQNMRLYFCFSESEGELRLVQEEYIPVFPG
jgi:hypothetical protein